MTTRRSGLGRGLSSLIPGATDVPAEEVLDVREGSSPFRVVPVSSIQTNSLQPRGRIEKEALKSLADSVKELGVLQPLLVRQITDEQFELIAGERRWRAAQLAGLQTVPVIVREASNINSLEQAVVENLHRKDLNAIDEASAYRQLIDDFEMTHEEVGRRVGKNRATISNLLRLLQLPAKVQKLLVDEKLTEGHARALLGTDDIAFQTQLAERAARDTMSVRSVEEAVRLRMELDKPQTKKRKKPQSAGNAAVLELQESLAEILHTKVGVSVGAKRGRIVIDFADLEDLERIASTIKGTQSPAQKA